MRTTLVAKRIQDSGEAGWHACRKEKSDVRAILYRLPGPAPSSAPRPDVTLVAKPKSDQRAIRRPPKACNCVMISFHEDEDASS